jgi:hypothetical protein
MVELRTMKIIYTVLIVVAIILTIGTAYNQLESQKLLNEIKETRSVIYTNGMTLGLRSGFDEGFVSGQHYGVGRATKMFGGNLSEETDFYTRQGFRSYNNSNYTVLELNPYKVKP